MSAQISAVRVVNAKDHQAGTVAQILGEAFAHDPVSMWINPDVSWPRQYFRVLTGHFFKRGEVHIMSDCSGAALWLPPRRTMRQIPLSGSLQLLSKIYSSGGTDAVWRSMAAAVYFDIYHIGKPHYYLHAIGVRKNLPGRGAGTLLLQEMLNRCDRESVPAYLENSNVRNLDFYSRNGFQVIRKIKLPFNGPELWLMMRRPLSH